MEDEAREMTRQDKTKLDETRRRIEQIQEIQQIQESTIQYYDTIQWGAIQYTIVSIIIP